MARTSVSELTDGQRVEELFLVRDSQFGNTKKGQPYARLRLGDASGTINAIFWDIPGASADTLRQNKFLTVRGSVRTYQGSLQVNIDSIKAAVVPPEKQGDFLPTSDVDIDALFARFEEIMSEVSNPHLAGFVKAFFADEKLSAGLRTAPAAVRMHHACIGGLLEHTASMAEAALALSGHYEFLDRSLLLVGVLIHDIGKIEEFDYDGGISYSDPGRLVGHIVIGIGIIERVAAAVEGFPKALLDVLKHYILSHHGVPEFGAIRSPMTAEALTLHYIDNLDAKLSAYQHAIDEPAAADSNWTAYQKMFEGYLYRGDPFAEVAGQDEVSGQDEGAQDDTGVRGGSDGGGLF